MLAGTNIENFDDRVKKLKKNLKDPTSLKPIVMSGFVGAWFGIKVQDEW
jgi:hypothetical protein